MEILFTSTQARYLKTIYDLRTDCQGVRITDLAAKLEISKASASIAVKRLETMGYVKKNARHVIFLSAAGEAAARSVAQCCEVLRSRLGLEIDNFSIMPVACELEAALERFEKAEPKDV